MGFPSATHLLQPTRPEWKRLKILPGLDAVSLPQRWSWDGWYSQVQNIPHYKITKKRVATGFGTWLEPLARSNFETIPSVSWPPMMEGRGMMMPKSPELVSQTNSRVGCSSTSFPSARNMSVEERRSASTKFGSRSWAEGVGTCKLRKTIPKRPMINGKARGTSSGKATPLFFPF